MSLQDLSRTKVRGDSPHTAQRSGRRAGRAQDGRHAPRPRSVRANRKTTRGSKV